MQNLATQISAIQKQIESLSLTEDNPVATALFPTIKAPQEQQQQLTALMHWMRANGAQRLCAQARAPRAKLNIRTNRYRMPSLAIDFSTGQIFKQVDDQLEPFSTLDAFKENWLIHQGHDMNGRTV